MLQVASFDISDDKGINALLQEYRLASGAHILVSDGKVCIPYEDGEPMNASQKTIELKENMHKMNQELSIILHSQNVLTAQIEKLSGEVAEAEANLAEAEAQPNKKGKTDLLAAHKKNLERLHNQRGQLVNQRVMNEKEIERIELNVAEFKRTIEKLAA
jgi:chromosome segregation ATPase